MRQSTSLSRPREEPGRTERAAVRVVLVDSSDAVLLLSTKDATNPDFGVSWELPGGGMIKRSLRQIVLNVRNVKNRFKEQKTWMHTSN